MSKPKGYGRIQISIELLKQSLHMPENVDIIEASLVDGHTLEISVRADGLPDKQIDARHPPLLHPTIFHKAESFEWFWNLEKELDDDDFKTVA